MNDFWSFATILATFLAAVVTALVPMIWMLHYDRYRSKLAAYEKWSLWLSTIQSEITHQRNSLHEMQGTFDQMVQQHSIAVVTKRFNEDFFRSSRIDMDYPRTVHVFSNLTRAYRDTVHTNAMLDRFENEAALYGQQFQENQNLPIPQSLTSLGCSVLGSLVGVGESFDSLEEIIAEEQDGLHSEEPSIFPDRFRYLFEEDCNCGCNSNQSN